MKLHAEFMMYALFHVMSYTSYMMMYELWYISYDDVQ